MKKPNVSENPVLRKLSSNSGISWLVIILAAACGVMLLIIVAEPLIIQIGDRMAVYGCSVALNKAQKAIEREELGGVELSYEEALAVMVKNQWAMDTLCPGGGSCYLSEEEETLPSGSLATPKKKFVVVCGLHDTDAKRRTRLNAQNARDQIVEEVKRKSLIGMAAPSSVSVELNGETLTATQRDVQLTGGTGVQSGTDSTVIYYTVDADGVSGFAFADTDNSANWRGLWGWDGTAYE